VTTVVVTVEPFNFALTSTPLIAPSAADETVPPSETVAAL
jgi:hypothetical protein